MTAITSEQAREHLATLIEDSDFYEIITSRGNFALFGWSGYRDHCKEYPGKPPLCREAITLATAAAHWDQLIGELSEDVTCCEIVQDCGAEWPDTYVNAMLMPWSIYRRLTGEDDLPAVTESQAAADFAALLHEVAETGKYAEIATEEWATRPAGKGAAGHAEPARLNAVLMTAAEYRETAERIGGSFGRFLRTVITEEEVCAEPLRFIQAVNSYRWFDSDGRNLDGDDYTEHAVSFEIIIPAGGSLLLMPLFEFEGMQENDAVLGSEARRRGNVGEMPIEEFEALLAWENAARDAADAARRAEWS